jgi:chaperone protein EcpD
MKNIIRATLAIATLLSATTTWAAIVVGGTRVIYPADSRDVSVRVSNMGNEPALVQSWVDDGDSSVRPEDLDVPFMVTPSVYRLDPSKTQIMRMVFLGASLPKDRESVYWLNVLDIPPKPSSGTGENYLQFAIKTRIKVFYRPTGLAGTAEAAVGTIKWSVQSVSDGVVSLKLDNPSPFYVSFAEIRLETSNGVAIEPANCMVDPRGSLVLIFRPAAGSMPQPSRVRFKAVNDYGAFIDGHADLRQ